MSYYLFTVNNRIEENYNEYSYLWFYRSGSDRWLHRPAIRQNLPQSQIIAYDINADTLREASQCGVANTVTTKIDASFSTCDYLFLCAPVQKNDENLSAVKKILSPKTLLTDVGSVKSEIHKEIKKAGLERQFIGRSSHGGK